jgi:hypothetical protein
VRAVPARLGPPDVRRKVHGQQDDGAVAQGVSPYCAANFVKTSPHPMPRRVATTPRGRIRLRGRAPGVGADGSAEAVSTRRGDVEAPGREGP